jgi:hypothetical protein
MKSGPETVEMVSAAYRLGFLRVMQARSGEMAQEWQGRRTKNGTSPVSPARFEHNS